MGIVISSLYEPYIQIRKSAACRRDFSNRKNGKPSATNINIDNWLKISYATTSDKNNKELAKNLEEVKSWIAAIIKAPPLNSRNEPEIYKITLGVSKMGRGVLGSAGGGKITINKDNSNEVIELNSKEINLNSVVLLHEFMHIFGLCNVYNTDDEICINNTKRRFKAKPYHTGKYSTLGYRKVLTEALGKKGEKLVKEMEEIDKEKGEMVGVPLEDYWGRGSNYAHEYGGYRPGVLLLERRDQEEPRYIVNKQNKKVRYPSQELELMAAFITQINYLTSTTTGMLKDRGFLLETDDNLIKDGWVQNIDSLSITDYSASKISTNNNLQKKEEQTKIIGKCLC